MKNITSPFPKSTYIRNAKIYKMMANPKRLEILNLLKKYELTGSDFVRVMGIRKADVSQNMTILRNLKLVKARRSGKNVFYSIVNPKIVEPCKILNDLWSSNHFSA